MLAFAQTYAAPTRRTTAARPRLPPVVLGAATVDPGGATVAERVLGAHRRAVQCLTEAALSHTHTMVAAVAGR